MRALQLIYSIFLGLVLAGFVWIGMDTFYPRPDYPESGVYGETGTAYDTAYAQWSLNTSIILLTIATIILTIAVLMAVGTAVLSNGLLLGGVFVMLMAVGWSLDSRQSLVRFLVIAGALIVTIVIGWLKFIRPIRRRPATPDAGEPAAASGAAVAGADVTDLTTRVQVLEDRITALRQALGDEPRNS